MTGPGFGVSFLAIGSSFTNGRNNKEFTQMFPVLGRISEQQSKGTPAQRERTKKWLDDALQFASTDEADKLILYLHADSLQKPFTACIQKSGRESDSKVRRHLEGIPRGVVLDCLLREMHKNGTVEDSRALRGTLLVHNPYGPDPFCTLHIVHNEPSMEIHIELQYE